MTITLTKQELQDIIAKHTTDLLMWKDELIPTLLKQLEYPDQTMSPIEQIRYALNKHCEKLPQIKFL